MTDHTPDTHTFKTCSRCGEAKSLIEFGKDKHSASGYAYACKACRNAHNRQYVCLTAQVESHKICPYCQKSKPATTEFFNRCKRSPGGLRSKCKECRKATRLEHRSARAEYNRQYYHANRDRIIAHVKSYYEANREARLRYLRNWQEKNQDRHGANKRASVLRRLARKRAAQGNHTAKDVERQYEAQKGKCYYCQANVGDVYHVDHVIPLSRGGSNGPENIVVACAPCNQSKSDKMPHEWPEGGRLL